MTPDQLTLWTNGHVASMDDDVGTIKDASIVTQAERIVWVGKAEQLPSEYTITTTHDLQACWVTPGLIDCHTHLVYAGNRADEFEQRLQGKSYAEIAQAGGGIQATVQATRSATEQELFASASNRLMHWLARGVTTIEIKSGYGLNTETEQKQLEVAKKLGQQWGVDVVKTLLGAHAKPAEFASNTDYIEYLCQDTLPKLKSLNLVDAVDGFCESIAFSPDELTPYFETAQQLGLPIKLHAEQLSQQGGTQLACKMKAISCEHLEYLTENDVKAMAESNTVAVLAPYAFYFLNETKKPPIDWFRQYNVPIAIATDHNPGSAPCSSLLTAMQMGCVLFGLTVEEVLLGTTQHAAKALNLHHNIGSITPNKVANFAVWDVESLSELVYKPDRCFASKRVYQGQIK